MPYRAPTLRPPSRPVRNIAHIALVFEAVLDRVACVAERVSSLVERSSLAVRLLLGLAFGVVVGVLAGVATVMLTADR